MLAVLLVIAAVALFSIAFYKWATINNNYFAKRGIDYLEPSFLIGNLGSVFLNKYSASEFADKIYNAFPKNRVYGLFDFRIPQFVVRDPEVIKQIAVKDFDHFEDHLGFADEKVDRFWGNTLFLMKGEKWRQMRATLSPAFTGSKMRQMFELVVECTDEIVKHFSKRTENGEKVNIEMKDFFSRYTNDVIASCAFGLKINSFTEPDNEFYLNGKDMMSFTGFKKMVYGLIIVKLPVIAKMLKISFVNAEIGQSFRDTILGTMEVRKKNNIHRPDMINIMMQVRDGTLKHQENERKEEKDGFATVEESEVGKVSVNRYWNDDEIVAQCFLFFAGGFDTSSTLLTFASYELMANPDIQDKLYEEIIETEKNLKGKRITYDVLQKMKYLDQVICESLRKWPPFVQVDRVCVKDYLYHDEDNMEFKVEKGMTFIFPIFGLHHDPKYFPEPDRFDPERFSDENKDSILPGTYIPFGVGPRNCIGSRFALMEVKAVLYYLLLHFSFEPNKDTQIPLKLKKVTFSPMSENGVHLELKQRKK